MREITSLDALDFLLIFEQIDFFISFSIEEKRAMICSHTHLVAYDVGEYLIQEGSAKDRSLFILLSGGASVVKQGALIPLAELTPGNFFGEVSFLTSKDRTTNVIVHPGDFLNEAKPLLPDVLLARLSHETNHATTWVLQIDPELMSHLDIKIRIKIKDLIIENLTGRVEMMHNKVVTMTGQDPILSVDPELEKQLHEGNNRPIADRELTKNRLIEQLAEFLDELNHCLVAG